MGVVTARLTVPTLDIGDQAGRALDVDVAALDPGGAVEAVLVDRAAALRGVGDVERVEPGAGVVGRREVQERVAVGEQVVRQAGQVRQGRGGLRRTGPTLASRLARMPLAKSWLALDRERVEVARRAATDRGDGAGAEPVVRTPPLPPAAQICLPSVTAERMISGRWRR